MSKNKSKNQAKVRPYAVMCTDLYLLWILVVYPLYYADGYFHLPEKKATFWCVSTLIYLGVTLFGVIITAFSDRELWTLENFKKNISMTDIFMFGFLVSNLIAFALSEDKVNAWTGASSRYYGAKVLILVCLVYFFVSRYAWVNKVFIWAFLIGGNGVCLLATLDYFWFDVLGINQQMVEYDCTIFISTMGNANTCASFCGMIVAVSMCLYCITESLTTKILAGLSIINTVVTVITSRSDSETLGIIAMGILVIFWSFKGKVRIQRILEVIILSSVSLALFVPISNYAAQREYRMRIYWQSDIPQFLSQKTWILWVIAIISSIFLIAINILLKKKTVSLKENKYIFKKKYIWMLSCLAVAICLIAIAYVTDFVGIFKSGMGMADSNTYVGGRLYTYDRTLQSFAKSSIINKLFGHGQASMTSTMNAYFGEELLANGISINSAHSHILDYLIICGIFGALTYLGTVLSALKQGIFSEKRNSNLMLCVCVVLTYFIQGFFNIDQTNTTVIFWLFIALVQAECRKEKRETTK